MFLRLLELSHCLPERAAWERLNEGMPANYDRGLALCFGPQGEWRGVKTYQGNQGVVYRSGPSNGTNFTPCCKLAGNTANRLAATTEALLNNAAELDEAERAWLTASLETYRANQDAIWETVEAKRQAAGIDDKTHRGYVFWADEQMRPVYSWPATKAYLVERAALTYAQRGGERQAGTCAVCGQGERTVYGNFAVLACYNLDKPGSIAGGFQAHQAHRNLPVCADCALTVADAFQFAKIHLASHMAGQRYLILPYSNDPAVREELQYRFTRRPERFQLGQQADLLSDENALLDEFAEQGDQLAFALIFYADNQASWQVKAEVQEVLPSRLRALQAAARQIEQAPELWVRHQDSTRPTRITAQTFKNFAGNRVKFSEATLRGWLTALFAGERIDRRHFLHALVERLLSTGRTEANIPPWLTQQAWGLYRYACLTGLLEPEYKEPHPAMSELIPNSAYGRYVQTHADFFSTPETVVAFLTGCYAAQVVSVQRQERGAEPFAKKFIGRRLSRQALQRLYAEGHSKLAQYDKLGYVITGLDPDLANAWVVCGDTWQISDDEATFAFTLGYSLAYRIGQSERAAAPA